MSSIHKTKFGTDELSWRENGKPKSKTYKTAGQAATAKVRVDRRNAEGRPTMRRKDVPTLEDFAAEFMAGKRLERSTRMKYLEWLEFHILPSLGHLPLVDLRPRRLAEWQRERLDAGAGPAVLGKAQGLLSQILNKAVLPHEYLEANPIAALDRPEYEKRGHRWLTAGEVEALRLWYLEREDVVSATLISCMAYVGPRPQDFLARSWTDLTARAPRFVRNPAPGAGSLRFTSRNSEGEIRPGSKSDSGQKDVVYVPRLVLADLEELRAASPNGGLGLIFPRASDGQPWTKTDYDNWRKRQPKKGKDGKVWHLKCFKTAAHETGLGVGLTPYALRHTAASLYAAAGWTYVEIAYQLRHQPATSLRYYQHLIHDAPPEEGKSIDDYIREARGLAPERETARA